MNSNTEETEDLRKQLELKNSEIKSNNKLIEKLLREKEVSVKYNEDLRDQLKLLSAKLHLHQSVIKTISSSVETQTDFTLFSHSFSENLFCSKCKHNLDSSDKSQDSKDWKQNSLTNCVTNRTKISDLVRETAEEVSQKNDFENDYLYDQKSKTYYSRSSGWYYYPDSYLFYDPKTQNYYKYDSEKKEYEFYSSLKDVTQKRQKSPKNLKSKKRKKYNKSDDNESDVIEVSSEEEEGEIEDSDEISIDSDQSYCSEERCESSPPLVRLIVKKSTTLEIGSLLLVTCMGAKIGNDSNCDLYITDESVSRSHAEIRYDYNQNNYVIKDLKSTNGTVINGTKIKKNSETVINHCDEISFGKCLLLVHIHRGKDVTCDNCEPGLVIASLKSNEVQNSFYSKTDKEIDRKKQLKSLKKKYGLKDADFIEPKTTLITNTNYKDRAGKRRVEKGSDNPYEKTAAGTSLDTALSKSNKGFQMLSKMGWTSGQALGRQEDGIVEPINVINPNFQNQTSEPTDG